MSSVTSAPRAAVGTLPATPTALPLSFAGWGTALPARHVTNSELSRTLDTSDAWVSERTGIQARYVAGGAETTASLAAEAGRRALASAGMTPDDVDLLVVATTTPDRTCPATAADTAALLGGRMAACDINSACTGFIYALHLVAPVVSSGATRTALVIGAERITSIVNPADRTTAVLFGDGAGALILTSSPPPAEGRTTPVPGAPPGPRSGVVLTTLAGDTSLLPHLEVPPGERWLSMDGPEVFRAAIRALVESGRTTLEGAGVTPEDVDWYVPHQANRRIITAAVDRLGLDPSRVVMTLDRHGNTSSASIPLALAEAADDGRIQPGDLVLTSALGAGMTWGSALLRWGRGA